jgi:post-segregation antitoxin (ccd killing protein)
MPRMQIYLPAELYAAVKRGGLPASELLQDAVRAEVRRRELLAASDQYVADLAAQVGKPTAQQRSRAEAVSRRIVARSRRKAS